VIWHKDKAVEHKIKIELDKKQFQVKTNGEGTADGINAFLTDIISHPKWTPGMDILLDHRKLNIDNLKIKNIDKVSDYFVKISKQLGDGRIALVMNRDVDFGIARAWELVTESNTDMHIHVFRSLEKAEAWLNNGQQS
jgi:hypothetical protein